MARNKYRVPKRQWRKWNANARNVFNTVFGTMTFNQTIYNAHPQTVLLARAQWRTVAWNAAFVAACSVARDA